MFKPPAQTAVHERLVDDLASGLVDHTPRACIVCNPAAAGGAESGSDTTSDIGAATMDDESLIGKFGKLSSVVKTRSADWKHKMITYIKNEQTPVDG